MSAPNDAQFLNLTRRQALEAETVVSICGVMATTQEQTQGPLLLLRLRTGSRFN